MFVVQRIVVSWFWPITIPTWYFAKKIEQVIRPLISKAVEREDEQEAERQARATAEQEVEEVIGKRRWN
jgi:hypothetical protein